MPPGNRKAPQRAASSESQYTLVEFMRDFPDDETCLTWLWNTRFNLGDDMAHCERCGEIRLFRRYASKQQRQDWTCTACGLHVHPTAGTIFHKSSTSLQLWFYAMYLMTSTRCGISAKQLERELGVTYKTAWRMFTLIRNELMGPEGTQPSGHVEMDETYIGGKPRASDECDHLTWPHRVHSIWPHLASSDGGVHPFVAGGLKPGAHGEEVEGGTVRADPTGSAGIGRSFDPGALPQIRRAPPNGASGT